MNRLIAGSAAAVSLFGLAIDGPGQSRTDALRADGQELKIVGCLIREADYARSVGIPPVPVDPTGPMQLVITERAGARVYVITGTREADLAPYVGRRVEVTGVLETVRVAAPVRGAAAPVSGTAGRVAAGEPPTGAQGVTPDGSPSHEPGDAVAGTSPIPEPSAARAPSGPAVDSPAAPPRVNVAAFQVVEGDCDPVPARTDQGGTTSTTPSTQAAKVPPRLPQPTAAVRTVRDEETIAATGCLVREMPGAAPSAQGANADDRFVLTGANLRVPRSTAGATAVPGSAPSGTGSGTVPSGTERSSAALPVEQSLEIALRDAADRAELARHVGQRVEIVGTIEAASPGRREAGSEEPPAVGTAAREPAAADVAHPTAPLRVTMTSVRAAGGSCD